MARSKYFNIPELERFKSLPECKDINLHSDKEAIEFAIEYAKSQLNNYYYYDEKIICSYDLYNKYSDHQYVFRCLNRQVGGAEFSEASKVLNEIHQILKNNSPKSYPYKKVYWYINKFSMEETIAKTVIILDNVILNKNDEIIKNKELIRMNIDFVLSHERYHKYTNNSKYDSRFYKDYIKLLKSKWMQREINNLRIYGITEQDSGLNSKITKVMMNLLDDLYEIMADRAGAIYAIKQRHKRMKNENK